MKKSNSGLILPPDDPPVSRKPPEKWSFNVGCGSTRVEERQELLQQLYSAAYPGIASDWSPNAETKDVLHSLLDAVSMIMVGQKPEVAEYT